MTCDPLGEWEAQWDAPLTDVHRRYIEVFEDWLRAPDDARAKHETRRGNLVELMRHDRVQSVRRQNGAGRVGDRSGALLRAVRQADSADGSEVGDGKV